MTLKLIFPVYSEHCLLPTQLTLAEQQLLDSELTKAEIDQALTQQKNNKSPGIDGYSAEFFKKFWAQLGHFFTDCVNECYKEGKLTASQSTGLQEFVEKLVTHIPFKHYLQNNISLYNQSA